LREMLRWGVFEVDLHFTSADDDRANSRTLERGMEGQVEDQGRNTVYKNQERIERKVGRDIVI